MEFFGSNDVGNGEMLKIIPKEEQKVMTMEEVDKTYNGYIVAFDITDFFPEDKGYVIAVSDDYNGISDFAISLPDYREREIFVRGASKMKWESGHVQEVYLW